MLQNFLATPPTPRLPHHHGPHSAPPALRCRIGTGQVVPGLDEALTTMRVGGLRRVYVPGNLAFPKSIKAAAGRPTVPANSPLVFDVKLLYIPGGPHGRPRGKERGGFSSLDCRPSVQYTLHQHSTA